MMFFPLPFKRKCGGMEKLSFEAKLFFDGFVHFKVSVKGVHQDRVQHLRKMKANLMLSSGLKMGFDEAETQTKECFLDFVQRQRVDQVSVTAGEGKGDASLFVQRNA